LQQVTSVTPADPKFASKSANPAESKSAQPPSSGAVGSSAGLGSPLLPHGLLESTATGATAPSLEISAADQAVYINMISITILILILYWFMSQTHNIENDQSLASTVVDKNMFIDV
jgi:hypothetical protein